MLKTVKGSSLVFALIILGFLLVAALSVATVSVTEKRSALSTDKSNVSFQVADSAAEVTLREIYQVNDKNVMPPNPPTGSFSTPSDLADSIESAGSATAACASSKIIGNVGAGSYEVTLYSADTDTPPNFTAIACNSNTWRNDVVKIKFQGTYRNTTRAIEVGIKVLP